MLASHGHLHVLEKLGDVELVVFDNFLEICFFDFKLLLELIDLFLLLVQNLVFLLFAT